MRKFLILVGLLWALPLTVHAQPMVALTFDDGPSGRFTRHLLAGLESREAKATFFLCGYRLEQYPELAVEMVNAGHEIGIHGFSHSSMAKMDAAQVRREIAATRALLPNGCSPVFFRPPGGQVSAGVTQAAAAEALALLSWSVDPRDWALHDANTVIHRVVEHVQDGDVILLHDMSDSSVDAALEIIDRLQARGFRFVTVSELAANRTQCITPGAVYSCFPSLKLRGNSETIYD